MPMWGVKHDESRRFMFSCGPESLKARNLAHNSHVVVMTESTVECFSVEGVTHRVTDATSCSQWIAQYVEKYASSMPDQTLELNRPGFSGGLLVRERSARRGVAHGNTFLRVRWGCRSRFLSGFGGC